MARGLSRRLFLATAAIAGAVVAAGTAGGCGQSARDRHFRARAVVHRPVSGERAAAIERASTRPIATVPTGAE